VPSYVQEQAKALAKLNAMVDGKEEQKEEENNGNDEKMNENEKNINNDVKVVENKEENIETKKSSIIKTNPVVEPQSDQHGMMKLDPSYILSQVFFFFLFFLSYKN
jgi:hypothetical protein